MYRKVSSKYNNLKNVDDPEKNEGTNARLFEPGIEFSNVSRGGAPLNSQI